MMLCQNCGFGNADGATVCALCNQSLGGVSLLQMQHALPPGSRLQSARYVTGHVMAQGGSSITYLGNDTRLRRLVAIKECFLEGCTRLGSDVHVLGCFQRHDIVAIYDSFEENNTSYIVTEYLPGKTLAELIKERGALTEREAVSISKDIAAALIAVHEKQWLHLDINPNNVMVGVNGRIVLMDFGSSQAFEKTPRHGTRQLTNDRRSGTPGYAPLEQYQHHSPLTPAADVHGLGATLYHMLVGDAPIEAKARDLSGERLAEVQSLNPQVTGTTSEAIMQAMEIESDKRPQSARAFLDLIVNNLPVVSTTARPSPPAPSSPTPSSVPFPPALELLIDEFLHCVFSTLVKVGLVTGAALVLGTTVYTVGKVLSNVGQPISFIGESVSERRTVTKPDDGFWAWTRPLKSAATSRRIDETESTSISPPSSVRIDAVGTWKGTFGGNPAILRVTHQSSRAFQGVLSTESRSGISRVAVKGEISLDNRKINIDETRVLMEPTSGLWSLGENKGTFTSSTQVTGWGQDVGGNRYTWHFAKFSSTVKMPSIEPHASASALDALSSAGTSGVGLALGKWIALEYVRWLVWP